MRKDDPSYDAEFVKSEGYVHDVSFLLPRANWFWDSLLRCDTGCCGRDAFDFRHVAIRWACGDDMKWPGRKKMRPWRDDHPGSALELAEAFRTAAVELETSEASLCNAGDLLTGTSAETAELLRQLAEWLEQALPQP